MSQAQRCCSTDDQDGTAREVSIGDARDAVGDARASSEDGDAGGARTLCPPFGSVDGCLFVASVYDADAFPYTAIIDGGDVTSTESEDDFDAFSLQDFGDQPAAVCHAHDGTATFLVRGTTSLYVISCSWFIPKCLWAEAFQVLPQVPRRFGCRHSHYRHHPVSYSLTRRKASCKML